MHALFGKKQIILATLILALGITVYLNWQFAQSGGDLAVTETVEGQKYGDAQLVNKNSSGSASAANQSPDAYFTQAKLDREKSRGASKEALEKTLADENTDSASKKEITEQIAAMAKAVEKEAAIENQVKAKNFSECMAYIEGDKVTVSVKTAGLVSSEVSQIKDIILKETGVAVQNINIVEVN
ncbi:SpoIIIAH-like family protein [Candidatus Soleaferrea massiliensis]|uniref:SpoIIIAH-like family protein n=1 Tax=Candidatus Soleaferrea massiliensis TaxID=1470354 RepID=UPI00058AC972|nr:SpoIIIAH-like family protein [Candidatus Soleaferrea massiliensis]